MKFFKDPKKLKRWLVSLTDEEMTKLMGACFAETYNRAVDKEEKRRGGERA